MRDSEGGKSQKKHTHTLERPVREKQKRELWKTSWTSEETAFPVKKRCFNFGFIENP